jgi:hypothetical protein
MMRKTCDDAPIEMAAIRDIVRVRSVRMKIEGDDVDCSRITQFNEQTTDGLRQAVSYVANRIPSVTLKGYVIDLRNNPGGLLDQTMSVSSAFLERSDIVSTRGRDPEDMQRYNAWQGDLTKRKSLIVLINGGSASASEIVGCALQDHRRVTLIGTRSFGKGSDQTVISLGARNGALHLTTAHYFTASGHSVQAKGISPDIEVLQDVPEGTNVRTHAALRRTVNPRCLATSRRRGTSRAVRTSRLVRRTTRCSRLRWTCCVVRAVSILKGHLGRPLRCAVGVRMKKRENQMSKSTMRLIVAGASVVMFLFGGAGSARAKGGSQGFYLNSFGLKSKEVTMQKGVMAVFASILLIADGSAAANADTSVHHKRIVGHKTVAPHHDITSFSSSSVLHEGVNHPPKNR